jgi:hypothetical protein
MPEPTDSPPAFEERRRYTWPWFVLGGVALGIILAVLWMSREIERTRKLREWNSPSPSAATNTSTTPPANR